MSPTVELLIGDTWTDITQWVYYRDLITITRGRPNEASGLNPATCALTLDNRDGRFSPRNPVGPYYGLIGRNTQLRVSIDQGGVQYYRFHGEVSSWPVRWDTANTPDVYIQAEASGLTRRLGQGTSPLRSPLFREMTNPARQNMVAYWPLEDPDGSQSAVSGLGGPPMTFTGTPAFASDTHWKGSEAIAQMGTGRFSGVVPDYTGTGETAIRGYLYAPAGTITATTPLLQVRTTGTARLIQLRIGAGGTLSVLVTDHNGNVLLTSGEVGFNMEGGPKSFVMELTQVGTDFTLNVISEDYTDVELYGDLPPRGSFEWTITGATVGNIRTVELNSSAALGALCLGHVVIANLLTAFSNMTNPAIGWAGENPASRISRLGTEEGIAVTLEFHGQLGNETTLGPQLRGSFLQLVTEAVATDLGMLVEDRDTPGITYRSRLSMYNQTPALSLDYSAGQLASPLTPTDDDQSIVNDITVSRIGGSSSEAELSDGALSTLDPPDGVGRYESSASISLAADAQLANQTGWRLHLGTVDEMRYPTLTVDLMSDAFTGNAALTSAALTADMGDRIAVSNLESWLPPGGTSQIIQGYREVLGLFEHAITFNCAPEVAYHAAFTDDASYGHVDTDGSSLVNAVDAVAASILVQTDNAGSAVWTTDASDFPFDISVGGEIMTVTGISGTTSPQTFTVTRSANGVSKAQTAGTDVRLAYPAIVSL